MAQHRVDDASLGIAQFVPQMRLRRRGRRV